LATEFLRTADIPATQVDRWPDGVHRIYRNELDVLIVRSAFPAAAMRHVGEILQSGAHELVAMPQEDPDIRKEQILFYGDPMSHNSVDEEGPPMERYLSHAAAWRDGCRRLFAADGDYETRLSALFGSLSGGRRVDVPHYSDGRTYSPSTIRMIPPGRGAPFHIDNYFDGVEGWQYLAKTMDLTHPINFFTMISPPEGGGEIEVSELGFNDPRSGGDGRINKDHSEFAAQPFSLQAGDLFVFASGRFWHHVREVRGSRPRWTIGGFLGFGSDDQTLFYWG
jgi:hypothetical protein